MKGFPRLVAAVHKKIRRNVMDQFLKAEDHVANLVASEHYISTQDEGGYMRIVNEVENLSICLSMSA